MGLSFQPFTLLPMNRLVPELVIAAALCVTGDIALAGEEDLSLPKMNSAQCPAPEYPREAVKNGEEGVVVTAIHVGADGSVLDTKILLSSGSRVLNNASQDYNRSCRFTPGKARGQPVAMWTRSEYIWEFHPPYSELVTKLANAARDGKPGNAGARYQLSALLGQPGRSEADLGKSRALKMNAAELGEPVAQVALGEMHEKGEGVAKNMDEARRWYAKAAAQGNVVAIDHLRFIGAPP